MSSQKSQKLLVRLRELKLENPEVSFVQSLKLTRKLTVVAVSTIMYLRDILPLEAFSEVNLVGQKVFLLRGCDAIPGSRTAVDWIESSFQLLNTRHLKKMRISVHKGIVTWEMYTLSFSYNHSSINFDMLGEVDGKTILEEHSQGLPDDVAKSVRILIRSIVTHTSTLEPLPSNLEISFKILLDGETPVETIPQLFHPTSEDDGLNFPTKVDTMKLGKVESKFMVFSVSSKSVLNGQYELDSPRGEHTPAQPVSEDEVPGSQDESGHLASSLPNTSKLDKNCTVTNDNTVTERHTNSTNLSEILSTMSFSEKVINCICECSELCDDTVKCVSCATFQHKTCYKILPNQQVDQHICVRCHNPDLGKPCSATDVLSEVNKKESAIYRQALMFCCDNSQVSCTRLMTYLRIPRKMAERIFQQLDVDGCFEPSVSKTIRIVKSGVAENVFSRFFGAHPPSDSSQMEIEDSVTTAPDMKDRGVKRQYEKDEKENYPPANEQKRRKILKTEN